MIKKYFIENQEIESELKKVKKEIYLSMNGVCAEEMAQKGIIYDQNYGVRFIRIKELALKHTPNFELAERLWYQNIREMQLLALLLMPVEEFSYENALEWNERITTIELAEIASFYLFSKMKDTNKYVENCINNENTNVQQTALLVASKCSNTISKETAKQWLSSIFEITYTNRLVARAAAVAVANIIRFHSSLRNEASSKVRLMLNTSNSNVSYFSQEVLDEIEFM